VEAQADNDNNDTESDDEGDEDDGCLYDTDDDDSDFIIVDRQKKKQGEKKTIPMQCSYHQFVVLLQELLTFHAWYRYGDPSFNHDLQQVHIDNIQLCIRKMIARIITYCPWNTGYGWKNQKLHDHLHCVIHLLYFHHAMNWDASHGK
jgi:hypothetical protein